MVEKNDLEEKVVELFDRLKYCENDVEKHFINIKDDNDKLMGYLEPIRSSKIADNEKIIELLTKWREENQFAFPTRFKVTKGGTKDWLFNNVIRNNSKILFMIKLLNEDYVGHMGLATFDFQNKSCEIDNIMKGVPSAPKGLMTFALKALINWTFKNFELNNIYSRVFYDNERALKLYKRVGFMEDSVIPLTKREFKDRIEFIEAKKNDSLDSKFLKMRLHKKILTAGPSISELEVKYVLDAVKTGWNENWDYYLKKFERKFADYVGVKHAISTSSCTGAMHVALIAMGIEPGDEIILPDLGWVATGNVILYVGAKPVFVDVDMNSFCVDPESIKKAINSKTKAIMPVHMYGHPANMGEIMNIAREYNLLVLEDAAPSIGAEINGKKTGSFGDIAAFSFQGAKMMVTGEGGMLVSDNKEYYQRACKLMDQGKSHNKTFWIDELGYKYKMSNIQAALGLAQLERVDKFIEKKIKINQWYTEELRDIKEIQVSSQSDYCKSVHWMTSIIVNDKIDRDLIIKEFKKRNIDSRPFFYPMSSFKYFNTSVENKNSIKLSKRGINLPSGVCLNQEDIMWIAKCIKEIIKQPKDLNGGL
jgi:perosamine synthetase